MTNLGKLQLRRVGCARLQQRVAVPSLQAKLLGRLDAAVPRSERLELKSATRTIQGIRDTTKFATYRDSKS